MKIPLQITFRSTPPSAAVEAHIREKADKLELFYDRIMGCRVVVDAPHRRHHKGKLYHVRVDMTVPGGELVVNREPSKKGAHEDIYVAIRDAFVAAQRQLKDYVRCHRGEVKAHEGAHRKNNVLEAGLDLMEVGTEEHLTELQDEKGS
jgi:ribosome-associated translation inhibitor RaiA